LVKTALVLLFLDKSANLANSQIYKGYI
jgi:hypothetical protein